MGDLDQKEKKEKKKKKVIAPLTFLEADLDWYIGQKKQESPEVAHATVDVAVKQEGGYEKDEAGVEKMEDVKDVKGWGGEGGGGVDGHGHKSVVDDVESGKSVLVAVNQDVVGSTPQQTHDVEMLVSRPSHLRAIFR